MGVGGWGTDQELEALLREGVKYAPDLIICQFCINDLDNILLPDPAIPIKETNRIYLTKPFRYELKDGRLDKIRLQPDGKGEKMTAGGWLREILAGSALLSRVKQFRSSLASRPATPGPVTDPAGDTDTDDPEGAVDPAPRGDQEARSKNKGQADPWWVRIPLNPASPHFAYLVDDGKPHPHPGWPLLEALLAEMERVARGINTRFLVFSESGDSGRRQWNLDWGRIQSDGEGDFIDWRGKRYPIDVLRPLKELEKICRRQGILLIKPGRGYPRYHNDPHTNSEGNRRMAEDIADYLIDKNLLPAPK